MELLEDYKKHDFPVRTVLIDSPWSTRYNDFVVDEARFPEPEKFFRGLENDGYRVVLWMTCMVNSRSKDTAITEDEAWYRRSTRWRSQCRRTPRRCRHCCWWTPRWHWRWRWRWRWRSRWGRTTFAIRAWFARARVELLRSMLAARGCKRPRLTKTYGGSRRYSFVAIAALWRRRRRWVRTAVGRAISS